jgi:dipeptidyl aminopeptidase/acylaminoacyl peptidase
MRRCILAWCVLALPSGAGAVDLAPTIEQSLGRNWPQQVQISPDGKYVAYEVREADWKENSFKTEIWLAATATGKCLQLTHSKRSSHSPQWSPNSKRLAFLSDRDGKTQAYLIVLDGGEAVPLTGHDTALAACRWSPDGRHLAFTAPDPEPKERKARLEKLGNFEVFQDEHSMSHLWQVEVPADSPAKPPTPKRLTKGDHFTVNSFAWSPDGKRIAFGAARTPAVRDLGSQDLYVLNVADGTFRKLVDTPGPDRNPVWSPDGKQIAYETANGREGFTYLNTRLAIIPADGGQPRVLMEDFDENPTLLEWGPAGIYFSALQRTARYLYRLEPGHKAPTDIGGPNAFAPCRHSFTADFKHTAFVQAGPNEFPEVSVAELAEFSPKRLSALGDQMKGFRRGTREVFSWKSTDGTRIEGVLTKPPDFDPLKKHPMLVVIHGGPTWLDTPALPVPFAYPLEQFVARGALVLQPNYRGSAGHGERFRSLNVRNLGLGDYADVISGVDDLVARGWVDRDRVGAMGWSQGGYISAFITCYSDRFRAVSVGAGISDWRTYYASTDIPPWARQYLKATPWDDPEIYRKTAPVSYLKRAKTPTLIQHGNRDERVPISNGYELYRGLQDRGVRVKLIVYKGHDHGVYKPREQRALMEQNYEWFGEYLWADKPVSSLSPRSAPTAERVATTRGTLKAAIAKALPLLEKGAEGHIAQRTCFACHNQGVPILALTTARQRGFSVRDANLKKQLEHIAAFLEQNKEHYVQGKGQGGQVDTAGYALLALDFGGWSPDATTEAVLDYLLLRNPNLDHWQTTSNRPPSEASDFAPTYLALRGLRRWGAPRQAERIAKRIDSARSWLVRTSAKDTEDCVFRLWGLQAAEADANLVQLAAQELIHSQRQDGGWGQTRQMASDAYASGTALVALHQAAAMSTDHPVYRRGVDFLLRTQQADGSWLVHSRSKPFQTYYESGFPHGKDQFISMAASAWATTALVLASPTAEPKPANHSTDGSRPEATPR